MRGTRVACIAAIAGLSFSLATCGSDSKKAAAPAAGGPVDVSLKEFSVTPSTANATAGKVAFTAKNDGKVVHEVVVVKLADGAGIDSITNADGTATEAASAGEAADIEPGASKSVTLDLPAGTYALICNLPGHFAGGMKTLLTVT